MNFHCFFEQSGTFKNMFKEFGHDAFDYDILNDYGQTDFSIDLFVEIEKGYESVISGGFRHDTSIFDDMMPENDFIIAFFPCTYFADRNELIFKLWNGGKKLPKDEKNIQRLIDRNKERAKFFELWLKFCFIIQTLGIPAIIENPASGGNRNYLEMFSPYEVSYKEKDRSLFGDEFKKPTNFFAINFEMKEKFEMFYDKNYKTKKILDITSKKISTGGRSQITSIYAQNFYKRFIEGKV